MQAKVLHVAGERAPGLVQQVIQALEPTGKQRGCLLSVLVLGRSQCGVGVTGSKPTIPCVPLTQEAKTPKLQESRRLRPWRALSSDSGANLKPVNHSLGALGRSKPK